MRRRINLLKRHYWISIAVMALLFLLALVRATLADPLVQTTVTVEMLAIPGALKLFAEKIRKVSQGSSRETIVKRYRNAWLLRIYVVNLVAAGNILLYGLSQGRNFMWLALVSFIVYMFCQPSLQELESVVREKKEVQ
jgi:uncharacterized membrane protein